MSLPDDSRPFVVLKQHASDFKAGFEGDIKSCLDLLDSKLSALICDPGLTNTSLRDGSRLSVDIQFTRAKYDIYANMKSLFEGLESSWNEQLEEMKKNFLENVEILLAKTKLEGKVNNDVRKSLKNPKGGNESPARNSPYSSYSLLAKAKQLPVISSLLPQDDESDEDVDENGYSMNDDLKNAGQSQSTSLQPHKTLIKKDPSPRKTQLQIVEEEELHDDDVEEEEDGLEIQEVVSARSSRNRSRNSAIPKSTPIKPTVVLTPLKKSAAKGRKSILKPDSLVESELHTTPSRSTRKRTAAKDTNLEVHVTPNRSTRKKTTFKDTNLDVDDVMDCEEIDLEAAPKTPKNVHFSVGLNVNDDLEIYSPVINLTRSAPRRKTVMTEVEDHFDDVSVTPVSRTKSKRKTIGVMDNVPVAPSPKRFKSSKNSSIPAEVEEEDTDLSRSESTSAGHYTPWLLLDDLDGKVPSQPGVYELKVYKAKKSAYIGSCDNLRHKLTLHKLSQNSGHKHLDKFLERNKKDVQVRYEIMPSAAQAKSEEMNRIKSFVQLYRTSPSYN